MPGLKEYAVLAAVEIPLYRVQGQDGRGPFKPGLTKYWAQPDSPGITRPSMLGANNAPDIHRRFKQGGWRHCGFACRTQEQIREWFRPKEVEMLKHMGYHIVRIHADLIIMEDEFQVMFFSRRHPSSFDELIPW